VAIHRNPPGPIIREAPRMTSTNLTEWTRRHETISGADSDPIGYIRAYYADTDDAHDHMRAIAGPLARVAATGEWYSRANLRAWRRRAQMVAKGSTR
jgi:hypothetical protein